MKLIQILLFIFTVISSIHALKILMFMPGLAKSHVMFTNRLAITMKEQLNHNVTILTALTHDTIDMKAPKGITYHRILASKYAGLMAKFMEYLFKGLPLRELIKVGDQFSDVFVDACMHVLEDEMSILNSIRDEKFDLILGHTFDHCAHIYAERTGIKHQAFTMIGTYITDLQAYTMGIPTTASFIPNFQMSSYGDRMRFFERLINGFLHFFNVFSLVYTDRGIFIKIDNKIHQAPDYDRQYMFEYMREASHMFINGEMMLDFPRPLLISTQYLGSVLEPIETKSNVKALPDKWHDIVYKSGSKGTILVSFGSVLRTEYVPKYFWLNLLRNLAKYSSDYTIIWKLDTQLEEATQYPNIHMTNWMPQKEILFDSRTVAFVTHGGYNSLLEGSQAGVPMVFIPLFVDQYGNAKRGERLSMGLTVDKAELLNNDTNYTPIADAIQTILTEPNYRIYAKKLVQMYSDKLIDGISLLDWNIRQTQKEHYARFTKLRVPSSYIVYFCLDSWFMILSIIYIALYILYKIIKHSVLLFLKKSA